MNLPRKCPECHNMYKKSGAHRVAPFVPRAGAKMLVKGVVCCVSIGGY